MSHPHGHNVNKIEKTICIIKPSAYEKREAIIATLRSHDFTVLEIRETTLTRAQATRLYVHHYGMPFYEGLIKSMISGPLCVVILQRLGAIAELRHLAGPTDPVMAKQVDPQCLRALYGKSSLDNGIHASKNAMEADREEDALFQRLKRTIILFGPPASGKGTQCDQIVSAYGVVHISTGDILRKHVKDGTEIGRSIKSYLDAGKLVPDALVTRLTLERLSEPDCEEKGWVLDGFPRTPIQAQSLIDHGLQVNRFVVLGVDSDTIVTRVSGRRFDPKTNTTYHLLYNPPPTGIVEQRCIQRSDDREEVIKERLRSYDSSIIGVIKQFHDVCVVPCEPRMGIHEVFALIVRCVETHASRKNVAIRAKSGNSRRRLTANL